MEPDEIKKLTGAVEQITKNFDELKNAGEMASKGATAAKEEVAKLAEKVSSQLEDIQKKQSQLEAAMQRPGAGGSGAKDEKSELEHKALQSYIRSGSLSPEEQKALSTDSNPDGGYFVGTENAGIINGRIFETSPMRRLANVRSTAMKSVTFDLDDDEADATWEGEGTSNPSNATPGTGQIEIVAKKITAEPSVTEEDLMDSALDVEAWLNGKIADKIGRKENTAFVNGNGVIQPRGFLTYAAWASAGVYERNKLEQIAAGSTSAITEAALITLQGSLKEDYQARASFTMNRAVLTGIMLNAGSSNYRFLNLQPSVGSTGQVLGAVMTLLEKPVVLFSDMPGVSSNTLPIAYGDFSRAYTVVDRVGISVLRDPFTSKGRVKFRSMKRVGGAVTNFDALKLLRASVS
ncbi:HK97 family phage major capsid protein [Bradyrhizobium diazoefficiens]